MQSRVVLLLVVVLYACTLVHGLATEDCKDRGADCLSHAPPKAWYTFSDPKFCRWCPLEALSKFYFPEEDRIPTNAEWVAIQTKGGVCKDDDFIQKHVWRPFCFTPTLADPVARGWHIAGKTPAGTEPQPNEGSFNHKIAAKVDGLFTHGCNRFVSMADCLSAPEVVCKFCPKAHLTAAWGDDTAVRSEPAALGACVSVSDTSPMARDMDSGDTYGCSITAANFGKTGAKGLELNIIKSFVKKGWVNPGESIPHEMSTKIAAAYVPTDDGGALGATDLGALNAEMIQLRAKAIGFLDPITFEVFRLNNFRRADPLWFNKEFAKIDEPLIDVPSMVKGGVRAGLNAAAAGAGFIVDGIELAFDAYKEGTTEHNNIAKRGPTAKLRFLQDVTTQQLWDAYVHTYGIASPTPAITPSEALDIMLAEMEKNPVTDAKIVQARAAKGNNHIGAKAGKFSIHVVTAILTVGVSIPFTASADLIATKYLDTIKKMDDDSKMKTILPGAFAHEMTILGKFMFEEAGFNIVDYKNYHKGSILCDITSTDANHDCAAGMYCKREWIFFPPTSDSFKRLDVKPYGICSPKAIVQMPANAPCSVHAECSTGLCNYNVVDIEVKIGGRVSTRQISIAKHSSRYPFPVENTFKIQGITAEQRALMTSGRCQYAIGKRPGVAMPEDCEVISDAHLFYACSKKELKTTQVSALKQLEEYSNAPPVFGRVKSVSVDDLDLLGEPLKAFVARKSATSATPATLQP